MGDQGISQDQRVDTEENLKKFENELDALLRKYGWSGILHVDTDVISFFLVNTLLNLHATTITRSNNE